MRERWVPKSVSNGDFVAAVWSPITCFELASACCCPDRIGNLLCERGCVEIDRLRDHFQIRRDGVDLFSSLA
jgi:hypothetical protein